jgi:hypothetical protein
MTYEVCSVKDTSGLEGTKKTTFDQMTADINKIENILVKYGTLIKHDLRGMYLSYTWFLKMKKGKIHLLIDYSDNRFNIRALKGIDLKPLDVLNDEAFELCTFTDFVKITDLNAKLRSFVSLF